MRSAQIDHSHYPVDELKRYRPMEQIAHRLNKDAAGLAPVEGLIQNLLVDAETARRQKGRVRSPIAKPQVYWL